MGRRRDGVPSGRCERNTSEAAYRYNWSSPIMSASALAAGSGATGENHSTMIVAEGSAIPASGCFRQGLVGEGCPIKVGHRSGQAIIECAETYHDCHPRFEATVRTLCA